MVLLWLLLLLSKSLWKLQRWAQHETLPPIGFSKTKEETPWVLLLIWLHAGKITFMFPVHRTEAHNLVPPGWTPTTGLQLLGNIEYLRIFTPCSVFWNFIRNLNLAKTLHLDLCLAAFWRRRERKRTAPTHNDPAVQWGPGEQFQIQHKQPCGGSSGPWLQGHFCPMFSGTRFWSHISGKLTNPLGHQGSKTRMRQTPGRQTAWFRAFCHGRG